MKSLILFLILCLANNLSAQDRPLVFKLREPVNDTLAVIEIDFDNENLTTAFVLQGKVPLHYFARMVNSQRVLLFRNDESGQKPEQEVLLYMANDFVSDSIISGIKIIDFNKDGNEDLVCFGMDDNSLRGALIYLNDPVQQKLVKLQNTADGSYFWVNPVYDRSKGTISCHDEDSDHGVLYDAVYRLDNLNAVPVSKHETGYKKNKKFDLRYKGNNGKWEPDK